MLQMPSKSTQFLKISWGGMPPDPPSFSCFAALLLWQPCLLKIIALNRPGEFVSRHPCLIFTKDPYILFRWPDHH